MKDNKTIEDGIKLQTEELNTWKKVLKEDVYNDLEYWITRTNQKAEDFWDIKRDSFITSFLTYYDPYYKEEVKKFKLKS